MDQFSSNSKAEIRRVFGQAVGAVAVAIRAHQDRAELVPTALWRRLYRGLGESLSDVELSSPMGAWVMTEVMKRSDGYDRARVLVDRSRSKDDLQALADKYEDSGVPHGQIGPTSIHLAYSFPDVLRVAAKYLVDRGREDEWAESGVTVREYLQARFNVAVPASSPVKSGQTSGCFGRCWSTPLNRGTISKKIRVRTLVFSHA